MKTGMNWFILIYIDKSTHTEYKIEFPYLYNNFSHYIHITWWHVYIKTEAPQLSAFYFHSLIKPLSPKCSVKSQEPLPDDEDEFELQAFVDPFLKDTSLYTDSTVSDIAMFWK